MERLGSARDACLSEPLGTIAVLRANAIGDLVVSLPAIEALRATYPNAEIVLLARDWHAGFLRGRSGPIDRVVPIPAYGGVSADEGVEGDSIELDNFFRQMQRERFDLAVQLHGGGRNSNPFLLRLGATVTAGTKTPDAPPLDRFIPYARWQHETLRCLEVVSLVGARPVTLAPYLTVMPSDVAEANAAVPDRDTPLIALHPGGTEPERYWPLEHFAAVGDALAHAGARVAVIGTENERDRIDEVVGRMRAEATNLAGRLSLGGLLGLLSRCSVVVGNDSGPLHLAAAAGAATVGIYSFFNLLTFGPLTRARHRAAVSWRLAPDGESYVTDVTVDEVRDAALELLRAR